MVHGFWDLLKVSSSLKGGFVCHCRLVFALGDQALGSIRAICFMARSAVHITCYPKQDLTIYPHCLTAQILSVQMRDVIF